MDSDDEVSSSEEPKNLLNIINVYAPTTTLVKKDIKLLDKMYERLSDLINKFKSKPNSINIIVGDFNAKVGKTEGVEYCLGNHSRGRRNNPGQMLINFCDVNSLFIANSAFDHSARHLLKTI